MYEDFEEVDYSNKNVKPWKKIISIVLRDKKNVILLVSSVFMLAIADLAYPLLNQYALETFIEKQIFDNAIPFIIFYVVFAILYGVIVALFILAANKIEIKVAYQLREESFRKLQELSFSYFDTTAQGWIMARVTADSRKLSIILSWGFIDFFWGFLSMIGILFILLIKNIKLALIIVAILPLLLGFALIMQKVILKHYRSARKINSEITGAYNEGFLGAKTIKSLVIEDKSIMNFENKARRYRKSALKAACFSSLFGPVIFIIGYIGVASTLYAGGIMVLGTTLLVSELYLFVEYTIKFFDPVISISRVLGDFQQAQASAERIVSLIEETPEIVDSKEVIQKYGTIFEPKRENFEPLIGDVEFKDVNFKYKTGQMVLTNFNLKVKAGSNVALVGHTGSGKSTIVNLICRFYEPTDGEILIDGRNYKERSITWLHDNLGYVLQTPQLFSGTIFENITYGKLDATLEEVKKVCKMIQADTFIEKLENKYDTFIGEGGSKLSLGEKQLISFARALIRDPRILILDEATSSIDTKTETLIQDAINVALKGRTCFMIAHRLSTVVNADLILVMKDGKIIESGKHHELLLKKGYYFELYKTQFEQEALNKVLSA